MTDETNVPVTAEEIAELVKPVIGACLLMRSDDPKLVDPRLGVAAEVGKAVVNRLAAEQRTVPSADLVEGDLDFRGTTEEEADQCSFYVDELPDGSVLTQYRYYRWGDTAIIAVGELNAPNHWDDEDFADTCRRVEAALSSIPSQSDEAGLVARPLEEWHEDYGDVVWWKFPITEPAMIGNPLDSAWPGYHTHWTPHPAIPTLRNQTKGSTDA